MADANSLDHNNKKLIKVAGLLGGTAVAGLSIFFVYGHYFPNTPDAYVHAYTVTVAPYVAGYIKTIHVQPNEYVKEGQLIYEIEPQPLQLIVDTKKNQLDASQARLASMEQELSKARDELKNNEAARWIVSLNQKRYAYLLSKQVVALEKEQELQASTLEADAQVARAQAEITRLEKRIEEQQARIKAHRSELGSATTDLNYTRYYAPMDSYISNSFSIRVGQYVKPGQALFQLVDNGQWWVDANFKEDQIRRIRPGMNAGIKLDMYPGHRFTGKVINISAGSGAYYSLLPPQNATGNWVKVPQRFPVRIQLEQNDKRPLRAGATAYATVNTF
ncbi:MAG: HlyD family secretion protein [Synechococcus sp.]